MYLVQDESLIKEEKDSGGAGFLRGGGAAAAAAMGNFVFRWYVESFFIYCSQISSTITDSCGRAAGIPPGNGFISWIYDAGISRS